MNLEELRSRLGQPTPPAYLSPDSNTTGIDTCMPGQFIETPHGQCFVVDTVRGANQFHGLHQFSGLRKLHPERIGKAMLDTTTPIDLDTAAFLDTETTGLGYGVGTQVFMIGVGHLDGSSFHVRQFFLRHPGEEPALLHALGAHLARFTTVVSFNGRGFDWPLIENRFIFRRIKPPIVDPVHIDLLHMSRRFWKRRLESCSLNSVESNILGVRRTRDDIEGWMIPQMYFQYMRSGNARPLRRVFYHNLHDILSLAVLTIHIDGIMKDAWGGLVHEPADFVSLGQIYERLEDDTTAIRCYEVALTQGLPKRMEGEAILRFALVEKRRRNWEAAAALFHRLIDRPGFERIACVELAKYHEHHARDHTEALRFTARAMASDDMPSPLRWPGTQKVELQHRKLRLSRRLNKPAFA